MSPFFSPKKGRFQLNEEMKEEQKEAAKTDKSPKSILEKKSPKNDKSLDKAFTSNIVSTATISDIQIDPE